MTLRIVPTSDADPVRSASISVGVVSPPLGAAWFKVEQIEGPSFSGFPMWIPAYAQSNYSIKWWSEYAVSSGHVLFKIHTKVGNQYSLSHI